MSMQGDVQSFLATMAKDAKDQTVTITPDQIALQTGITRDKVNKTLNNLMTRKRIELLRGPNGRSITGYRMLEVPTDKRRRSNGNGHAPQPEHHVADQPEVQSAEPEEHQPRQYRRRLVITPLLDQYVAQKKKFEAIVEEFGDRIEASFRADPLAEEGLALQERLTIVEQQLHEWRARAEEAERNERALRTRHVQAVERKAVEAGAVAVHGD